MTEVSYEGYRCSRCGTELEVIGTSDAPSVCQVTPCVSCRKPDNAVIVCLCGSTRFQKEFQEARQKFTLAGKIVVGPEVVTTAGSVDEKEKASLDELHRVKIDLADYVYVVNVGGYVGQSTAREIIHALDRGKPIRFLNPNGVHGVPGIRDLVRIAYGDSAREEALRKNDWSWADTGRGIEIFLDGEFLISVFRPKEVEAFKRLIDR